MTGKTINPVSTLGGLHRIAVCSGVMLIAVSLAMAQTPDRDAGRTSDKNRNVRSLTRSTPIDPSPVPTLRVTTNGRIQEYRLPDGQAGGVAGAEICGPRTYTDPNNFTATTPIEVNLQTGMVDGEGGAISFPIDPALFPLKFESAECLFAQSHFTPTLTKWSMTLWDGPPKPGQGLPVHTVISDGSVVPHISMPGPGSARAINLKVEVDPSDPEQVFLFNDSGENMISVSFKIEELNNSPNDPCSNPPDEDTNAFMVTDTDSTSASDTQNNWLIALACGGLCDGTNRFADLLPIFCQPTGDWIMRLTFSCTLTGACCDVDGLCQNEATDRDCADQRGTFMGDNAVCNEVVCPPPVGACCFNDGCLEDVEPSLCNALATAFYMGNGSLCQEVDCSLGACCFPDGSCQNLIDVQCTDGGGVFHAGASCSNFSCPQPRGACCIGESCVPNQARNVCLDVGGEFAGINVPCSPNLCTTGACPNTTILQASPPSGTVDARQPSAVASALPRLGIGSQDEPIRLTLGESGAAADCFTLCETMVDPLAGVNGIASVSDLGGGIHEIRLTHAIAAGGTTMIRYFNDPNPVSYTSHPGNANADSASAPSDILFLIDMLNGVSAAPHGLYSTDIDRSGVAGPPDILRLIDLLNGASAFDSWLNSSKPAGACP